MLQTWHIFKKDVWYLRYEIALLLAIAVLFVWTTTRGVMAGDVIDALEPLFGAAAAYTIARLIYAESLPGENQFWLTRPYARPSLLAAKLLFILAFINMPLFIAQAAILIDTGFPIASILPGLLWTQVMILFCVALPLMVLATLTTGLVPFIGVLLAIALAILCVGYFGFWNRIVDVTAPEGIEWLHYSLLVLALVAIAPPVLYLQYRFRQTRLSRAWALSIAVCAASLFLYLPWRALFPVQSLLSKQSFATLQVKVDPTRKLTFQPWTGDVPGVRAGARRLLGSSSQLNLPLVIEGAPGGIVAQVESYSLGIAIAGHRPVTFSSMSLLKGSNPHEYLLRGYTFIDPSLTRGQMMLRGSFYLTAFGNSRGRTITLRRSPQDVMDGVQCYAGMLNQLECRAPFRWPARIISQASSTGAKSPLPRLISYSPFPANLQLNPVVRKNVTYYSQQPLPDDRPVTMEFEEPLAYLRRDVEVQLPPQ